MISLVYIFTKAPYLYKNLHFQGLLSEEDTSQWGQFKESLEPLFRRKNIYLLLPLCSTGAFLVIYLIEPYLDAEALGVHI